MTIGNVACRETGDVAKQLACLTPATADSGTADNPSSGSVLHRQGAQFHGRADLSESVPPPALPHLTFSTTGKSRWKYAYLRLLRDYRTLQQSAADGQAKYNDLVGRVTEAENRALLWFATTLLALGILIILATFRIL